MTATDTARASNLTDITDVSDAVLEVFMRVKGGEDNVVVSHLTNLERLAVARLMKWEMTPFVLSWIYD